MARVPNCESRDQAGKRFLKTFDRLVAAIEQRNYVYAWSTNDDEIAEDAIIVGIGGTSAEMILAGLSYVEPSASIYWCAQITRNGAFDAGGEMETLQVPAALTRAHELCVRMGYVRVILSFAEVGIWQAEWGRLAHKEGY